MGYYTEEEQQLIEELIVTCENVLALNKLSEKDFCITCGIYILDIISNIGYINLYKGYPYWD